MIFQEGGREGVYIKKKTINIIKICLVPKGNIELISGSRVDGGIILSIYLKTRLVRNNKYVETIFSMSFLFTFFLLVAPIQIYAFHKIQFVLWGYPLKILTIAFTSVLSPCLFHIWSPRRILAKWS